MNTPTQSQLTRGVTLLLTNATKLGGLAVALNEMLLRANLRPMAVAAAAFMMAGAQLSENAVMAVFDRLLGRSENVTETKS